MPRDKKTERPIPHEMANRVCVHCGITEREMIEATKCLENSQCIPRARDFYVSRHVIKRSDIVEYEETLAACPDHPVKVRITNA